MPKYLDEAGLAANIQIAKDTFMPKMTVDSSPTANSTNLVTSGGVHSAISSKADDNGVVHLTGAETISGTKTFQATGSTNGQIDISNSINAKTVAIYTDWSWIKRAIKGGSVTLQQALNEKQNVIDSTHKLDYSLIDNAPAIPSAPGTLNTTATSAQSTNSSEALSGNITLHKVSKTGSYNDLNNTPTIPTVPTISTDISADATSDTKTASPKAVKTFVEGKGYGTYSKPSGGIPATDLASAVQTSLGKADTALQSYTETDPTVPAWAKASSKPTYTASEVGALPSTTVIPDAPGTLNTDNSTAQTASSSEALSGTIKLHKVSKTGSYNDLLNKPTIPTISLNGSSTTSASFYAPTSAGTQGYVLTSNGSGAPTWAEPSGGGGDVFVATYGTTTYADILAAYNGGSTVVLTKAGSGTYGAYQTQIGTLAFVDTAFQTIVFIGGTYQTLSGKNALYIYRVVSSATWTETEYTPTFQRERSVSTSKPSGGFVANTIYDLGTLTGSQTFSLATNSSTTICVEWVWSFVTGSTAPTITWPSGLTWEGGSAPTVSPNSLYEISVRRMGSSYLVAYYKEVAL